MDPRRARRFSVAAASVSVVAMCFADTAAAAPDLVVSRVSHGLLGTTFGGSGERGVGAGARIRIAERTKNSGDTLAPGSTTRYFLDDQPLRALRGRRVGALAPGGSSAGVTEVSVPSVSPGTYRLIACADGSERIRERRESNNCRTSSRLIRVRDNARPAVFIGGGAATGAFTEGTAALLAPGLTVSDADDERFTGATVGIAGGGKGAAIGAFHALSVVPQLGITGTYNTGTGVLTLTGAASVADYQRALRSIWYQFIGDDPRGPYTARFRVRDGAGVWSAPTAVSISVDPVTDTPERVVGTPDSREAILSGLSLRDPDSDIAGASVEIVSGFNGATDRLTVDSPSGITGTYDSGTGILTLTGNAPDAAYQEALRSVRFVSSGGGARTFRLRLTDASGASPPPADFSISG